MGGGIALSAPRGPDCVDMRRRGKSKAGDVKSERGSGKERGRAMKEASREF